MLFEFGGLFRKVWRGALILGTLVIGTNTLFVAPVSAATGINQQLNFQGRLLNAQGAIVVDGFYNVEFKIYQDGTGTVAGNPGGTLKWTEDWLNSGGNAVKVVNGYMSVQLGSINPFGNSIDWNQDTIWLSINIGNTASCTITTNFTADCGGDGEMLPMKRLSAVPYSLNSARLGGLTSADFIQNTTTVQAGANLAIGGTARADTSILTPAVDTNTAVALNIGTTNATSINLNQNVTVAAGKSLTLAGGNTASRPASPTEGMMYYDTTTKQMLVYSNGKWQADRNSSTKIVAASNASQALKDSADYVADGTGDQTEINAALTAAAGGKVYLTEGTYTIGASISLPNNTALVGAGAGTIITLPNAQNGTYSMITNTDTTTGTNGIIRDLKIDGNKANQTSGNMTGIYFDHMGGSSGTTARTGGTISGVIVSNIYTGTGIVLSLSNNNKVTNTMVQNTGGSGIRSTNSGYNTYSNNFLQGNSTAGIYFDANSFRSTVSNNNIQANSFAGVYLFNSNDNTVASNTISDSGTTTNNNAIYIDGTSTRTSIANNLLVDTSPSGTNYAINITVNTVGTYLSNNLFNSTSTTSIINDASITTVYANQPRAENGGRVTNRTANDTAAFTVQNAAGTSILAVDTTNSKVLVAGALDTTTATTLSIGTTTATAINIGSASTTTTIAGNTSVTLNATTGTDMVCRNTGTGILSVCDAAYLTPTATNFIQNQNGSLQTGNFRINGTGQADTSLLTPLLDTATAVALNIGTTNATSVNINQNTTIAAGKSLTLTGGNTASRPASPTEGMVYYDTTTKQLLVYSNGKWQADRNSSTKIVAASNASQALKDSADYVATGSSDQATINTALTAAAGGRVYLTEGTYTTDDAISIPNDTTLAGAGRGSLIKFANINGQAKNMITNSDTGATSKGVTVRDLQLDGNWTGVNTTGTISGISFNALGGGSGSSARQGPTILNTWIVNFLTNGILLTSSPNGVISGNNVQAGGGNGIYLSSSNRMTITGNVSQGNTGSGIVLGGVNSDAITGNTFAVNGTAGIYVNGGSNNNNISANTLYNNGGNTTNNAIYFPGSANGDNNTITNNTINDTSGTTNNYAINFVDNTSNNNYLAGNVFTSTAGTATINDPAGTNTVYANQSRGEAGAKLTNRTANDTEAFAVQSASGSSVFAVDTTNNQVVIGNTSTAGAITLSDGSSNTLTLNIGALAGNYTVTIPTVTANDTVCLQNLANCGSGGTGVTTVGALDGGTANANGATIVGTNIYLQSASASFAGLVNTTSQTFAGAKTFNESITLAAAKTINMAGGTTASRPASPTEGMIYYDTSTKQLLTYANGKWQADRNNAVLVAASNSSDADKAAADYVATGTGDQTPINSALTAADPASGTRKTGRVYLFAGTYTINGTISVPNNTTLAGAGSGTLITIPNSVNATFTAVTNTTTGGNGTGVVIQDLKLDGNKANQTPGNYGMYGITFNGMGSSTLQGGKILNVWVNNWYGNGAFLWTYSGIYISTGQRNTISNASVYGNTNNGIAITGTYTTVTGSEFTANNYGIHLAANNNTITGNTASANTANGIYLDTASQNTLTGNVATGNTTTNIYLSGSNSNTISGNQALGSASNDGVGLSNTSTYNIISSNIIQANSAGGVSLASSSSNNTVTGNKIHNNGGNNNRGIYFNNASNNTITNNTITDTVNTASNNPINIDASSSNTYLSGNTFSSTATGGTIVDAGTGTVYVNQSKSEGGGQVTNRVANDAAAFTFQRADGTNVLTVDTANSKVLVAGTLDTTTATTLSIGTATANAISIGKTGITTTIAGDTGVTLNATTGTTMVCHNTTGLLSTCDATYLTPTVTNFIQNTATQQAGTANFNISGSGTAATSLLTPLVDGLSGTLSLGTGAGSTSVTIGKAAATTLIASSTVTVGTSGSTTAIQGATQTTNNTAGDAMTIVGSAGLGSGNGGTVTLQGGNAGATGTLGGNLTLAGGTGSTSNGAVILATSTFQTATSDTSCFPGGSESTSTTNCTIAQNSINNNASVIIGFTNDAQTAFMPDPSIITAGRVVYVTASGATKDFTLSVNGGGQGNQIAMRKNTTATMIWNGADWTAAGASSSTTMQAAYDNTLQSAGGAELVVSKTSATNGLTIRDSLTNSVNGALLTVQSSSAANLFSVNSNVTEYTSNSGAETYSGTTTTFPASTWVALTGSTVTRNVTTTNIATGQGSAQVATSTTAGSGVKNVLTTSMTAGQHYNVSFSAKLSSGTFTDMGVYYSVDGTANTVACSTNEAIKTSVWTKVNCTFTAPSSGITANNSINIRQIGSGTSRTFYLDNISVTIAADYNYATDGGADDNVNFATNWVTAGLGTVAVTRNTSDGYDASSSAQAAVTAGAANAGVRNKLSISPLPSTLYRVSVYAKLSSGTFADFKIRYSRDGSTTAGGNYVDCVDYNTQTITTSGWTQITCYVTTDGTAASNPYVYFVETASATRTFYVDAFSMTLASNSTPNVQIGSGSNGGPTTLFTLDKGASAPIAANNDALLGSMYYDTTLGKLQCYEADGWGACGSSPDNIITISPEYTNAVLHGTGVGTMTSDLCSDYLNINDGSSGQPTICGTNETYNFYKWTSPQSTTQTYSLYVTYQLPTTFKSFNSGQTSLMARTDNGSVSGASSTVQYSILKNIPGSGTSPCGGTTTVSTGTQTTWQTVTASGAADPSTCGFGPGDSIVFKIDLTVSRNANAYVGNLNFAFSNK